MTNTNRINPIKTSHGATSMKKKNKKIQPISDAVIFDPDEFTDYICLRSIDKELLAYYFYLRRIDWNRDGNKEDDYYKAEYAVNLNDYLLSRSPEKYVHFFRESCPPDKIEPAKEFLIRIVYGIFDTAYYLHVKNHNLSPYDNFIQAEKICCREKEIDYYARQVQLERQKLGQVGTEEGDRKKAEKIIEENRIREKAEQIYIKRMLEKKHGTAEDDWIRAEKEYINEEITRKIANRCWEISNEKFMPPSVFWHYATQVIHELGDPVYNKLDDFYLIDHVIKAIKMVLQKAENNSSTN